MDLTEFYRRFIELIDYIAPTLSSSEERIFSRIFARTIAEGKDYCDLSYQDLHNLTGLNILTIKRSIKKLILRDLISIIRPASPRIPQRYRILWPREFKRNPKLHRDPVLLLKEAYKEEGLYEGLLSKLTEDDKRLLQLLKETLSPAEETRLRSKAAKLLQGGENVEDKFQELIVLTKFGPDRLRKYE